jgi:hypothetical protein
VTVTGERRKLFQLRVWHGMTVSAWFRMLGRNGYRTSPSRYYLVALFSMTSVANSTFATIQELLLGRKIDRTELPQDPLLHTWALAIRHNAVARPPGFGSIRHHPAGHRIVRH